MRYYIFLMLAIYAVIMLILYISSCCGFYTIANKRGCTNKFLAFVPILQWSLTGQIVPDFTIRTRKVRNVPLLMIWLTLLLGLCVLPMLFILIIELLKTESAYTLYGFMHSSVIKTGMAEEALAVIYAVLRWIEVIAGIIAYIFSIFITFIIIREYRDRYKLLLTLLGGIGIWIAVSYSEKPVSGGVKIKNRTVFDPSSRVEYITRNTTSQFFCENCGARLSADSKFCENCGNPINGGRGQV